MSLHFPERTVNYYTIPLLLVSNRNTEQEIYTYLQDVRSTQIVIARRGKINYLQKPRVLISELYIQQIRWRPSATKTITMESAPKRRKTQTSVQDFFR